MSSEIKLFKIKCFVALWNVMPKNERRVSYQLVLVLHPNTYPSQTAVWLMAVRGAHIWSSVGGQLSSYSNATKLGTSGSCPNKCLCDYKAAPFVQKSRSFFCFSWHDLITFSDPPLTHLSNQPFDMASCTYITCQCTSTKTDGADFKLFLKHGHFQDPRICVYYEPCCICIKIM